MGKIVQSKVIHTGKIIDNYLVNFPQFINKEENSIYKLVIGENLTCFVIKTYANGATIRLPYYQFGEEHAQFISWGDGVTRRSDDPENFLTHTYATPGRYQIHILGDTPDLFSIATSEYYNNLPSTEKTKVNNFKTYLIEIKKLGETLTNLSSVFQNYINLSGIPDEPLPSKIKNCDSMFNGCTSLKYIPFNFEFPEQCISFKTMFYRSGLKTIFNQNLKLPYTTTNVNYMFYQTNLENIPSNFFNNVTSSLTCLCGMFGYCRKLKEAKFNTSLPYIVNATGMFDGCWELSYVNINLPKVKYISGICQTCSSLVSVSGFHINEYTENADRAFMNCRKLSQDVNDILTYFADFNLRYINYTFKDCVQLKGTPKEQYLWKSYSLGSLKQKPFQNCHNLTNYNYITLNWGGVDDLNYWYGSYQIQIKNVEEDIYCLPIYKFLSGNSNSSFNREYTTYNNQSGILAPYDFYISYGDGTAWQHVTIGDSVFFNSLWQNNKESPFFGYPKTYKINFDNNGDKLNTYQNLVNDSFFGYVYRSITHIYKEPGTYKIMIMGQIPRFYVQDNDKETNRHLYRLITVNRLPFTTLDHAFTNAWNLRYLPNESLKQFPILSGASNWARLTGTVEYNGQTLSTYMNSDYSIIIHPDSNYYAKQGDDWIQIYPDPDSLVPSTYISLSSLTRSQLLHTIPTSETMYTFAHVNGYKDNLNKKPSLFNINSGVTTFKYHTNKI